MESKELEVQYKGEIEGAKASMTGADVILVDSAEMYEVADAMLSETHTAIKRFDEAYAPTLSSAKKTYDEARAFRALVIDPLENSKQTLRRKMGEYKAAESIRIAAEERAAQQRRQEEIDKTAAALDAVGEKLAAGEATIEEFTRAEADASIAEVSMPAVASAVRGRSGVALDWEVDFTDIPAFLEFLAADLRTAAPRFGDTLGEFKISQLKSFAKSNKGTVSIPGVTFKPKASIRARS